MKTTTFIGLGILALIFITGCTTTPPYVPPSLQESCENFQGNWIEETKECEYISQDQCDTLNGQFNPCASACRNDPLAEACTAQCVPVCRFASN